VRGHSDGLGPQGRGFDLYRDLGIVYDVVGNVGCSSDWNYLKRTVNKRYFVKDHRPATIVDLGIFEYHPLQMHSIRSGGSPIGHIRCAVCMRGFADQCGAQTKGEDIAGQPPLGEILTASGRSKRRREAGCSALDPAFTSHVERRTEIYTSLNTRMSLVAGAPPTPPRRTAHRRYSPYTPYHSSAAYFAMPSRSFSRISDAVRCEIHSSVSIGRGQLTCHPPGRVQDAMRTSDCCERHFSNKATVSRR
jgi:hypothetical protein